LSSLIFAIGKTPPSDAISHQEGILRVSTGFLPDQRLDEVPASSTNSTGIEAGTYRLAHQRGAVVTGTLYQAAASNLRFESDRAEQAFDDQGKFRSVVVQDFRIQDQTTQFIDSLFIYGTLMQGQCRQQYLPNSAILSRDAATCRGRLFDTGNEYPALQWTEPENKEVVYGELLRCRNLPELLKTLDEVEGFVGYNRAGNLYDRRLFPVQSNGRAVLAWTYTDAGMHPNLTPIPSGCWRTHQQSSEGS
jgi:gamma-glutamylcyclotransferase (GGCT)/AIG2-like uncharacterized protein YtfP